MVEDIIIASHNPGKVSEMAALLAALGLKAQSAAALGVAEPEEAGATFAQNAAQKAEHCAQECGRWALADDSGLELAALGNRPGIYSARLAGPKRDFARAMQNLEGQLRTCELSAPVDRRAAFVCALALARPGHQTQIFEGRIEGQWLWPPRGEQGFGYDPVFQPPGFEQSFGEMDPAIKHAINHRARAFAKLKNAWPLA